MVYKAIGMMSGSSLDGLDIAYVHFQETAGKWSYELLHTDCCEYTEEWASKLKNAVTLPALDYQLLHAAYGRFMGEAVNQFIDAHQLHHQVDIIVSHGHTTFHLPKRQMTAQLGDGAAIAAATGLPVISDLRALDVAFGGQGAPIVPIGEKLLMNENQFFLNLGGIANLSYNDPEHYTAFDVCPANRVLNMLIQPIGKAFDEGGKIAATGNINQPLLNELNAQPYYQLDFPKSLANDFGTEIIYPLIQKYQLSIPNTLRTYVEHIAVQIKNAIQKIMPHLPAGQAGSPLPTPHSLFTTGGGALSHFMVERITAQVRDLSIEVIVPDKNLVNFKEALIVALIGVLRWREENNVLASVTGAKRNSINGAIWMGAEA
jgi:anhydro-N-acetylmuramic acid kinase